MKGFLSVALLALVLLAGCTSGPTPPKVLEPGADGAYHVLMAGSRFIPSNAQVPVGANVTWSNQEGVPHDVHATDGSYSSGAIAGMSQGETFTQRFTAAGTYTYVCKAHESLGMKGTITVVA